MKVLITVRDPGLGHQLGKVLRLRIQYLGSPRGADNGLVTQMVADDLGAALMGAALREGGLPAVALTRELLRAEETWLQDQLNFLRLPLPRLKEPVPDPVPNP